MISHFLSIYIYICMYISIHLSIYIDRWIYKFIKNINQVEKKQDRNWIIIIITGLVIVKEHEIHIEPKSYKLELLGKLGF